MSLNFNENAYYSVQFNEREADPALSIQESAVRQRAKTTTNELFKFFQKATSIDSKSQTELSRFLDVFEGRVVQHIQRTHSWIGNLIIAFQRFTRLGTLGSIERSREKLQKLPIDERVHRVVLPKIPSIVVEEQPIVFKVIVASPSPAIQKIAPTEKPALSLYFNTELASAMLMMRNDPKQAAVSFAKNAMLSEERTIALERLNGHVSSGKIPEATFATFRDCYGCIEALTIKDFLSFDESASTLKKPDLNALQESIKRKLPDLQTTLEDFSRLRGIVELLKAGKEDEALELTFGNYEPVQTLKNMFDSLEKHNLYPNFVSTAKPFLPVLQMVQSSHIFQAWDIFREHFSKMPFAQAKELFAKLKALISDNENAAYACQSFSDRIEVMEAFDKLVVQKEITKIHDFIQAQSIHELYLLIEYMHNNPECVPAASQVEIWTRTLDLLESDLEACYDQKLFASLSNDEDERNEQIAQRLINQESLHELQRLCVMRLRAQVATMTEPMYREFLAKIVPTKTSRREKYDLLIRYDVDSNHLQKGAQQVVIGAGEATIDTLALEIKEAKTTLAELQGLFSNAGFTDEELERRFGSDFTEAGAREHLQEKIERETRKEIQETRKQKGLKALSSAALDKAYQKAMPIKKMRAEIDKLMPDYFRRGYIVETINQLIKNLQEKKRIALMPAGTAGIRWCLEMELGLVKIMEKLKDAPKETVKECLGDIICSVGHCAVGIEEAIIKRYRQQVMQLAPTPDEDIYQDLAGFRAILCESVLSPPGDESVMFYAKLGKHLGKEFGLPGFERFQQSRATQFTTGGTINNTRERHRFQGIYSAAAIVEYVTPQVNEVTARKEYCYSSIPPGWKRPLGMEYEALRTLIKQWQAAQVPPEKIIKDLQDDRYDLWIQKKDLADIDAAIHQAKKSEYMASITTNDKISQRGILNMLQNMGVLTPAVQVRDRP